jgi:hypothetical protein
VPTGVSTPSASLVGVALALAAAVLFALGTVAQQEVAVADATEHDRLGLLRLLRSRTWLLGQGATLLAAGLQVLALAFAPVTLVQPLLALGLVLALGLRLARERRSPVRTELVGAVLTAGGLGAFLLAARPVPGQDVRPGTGLTGAAVLVAVVVVGAAALLRTGRVGAVVGGSAAGVALGLAAVLTSAALAGLRADGASTLLTTAPWAAAGVAVLAEVACQQAFSRGALAWSLPALTVLDPLAAVPAAHLLLGERLVPALTHVWLPAAAVAVAGVVLLAARPGERESGSPSSRAVEPGRGNA